MKQTELDALILKHRDRLREIEKEADRIMDKAIDEFSDDYRGKILFSLGLALSVRRLCSVYPGIKEETFVRDARRGAALWVEHGEPLGNESKEN